MAARPGWASAAGQQRARLAQLEWVGIGLGAAGALTVALASPVAGDAVLAYFLTLLGATIAYRDGIRAAFIAVPVALIAHRAALDLSGRELPTEIYTAACLALFAGGAFAAAAAGTLKKETRGIRYAQGLRDRVGYEVFTLILGKDIARCQRHKYTGALALIRLKNLAPLLKPDAYQQHDVLVANILPALEANIRRSDTACYLGGLHFVFVFPHTNSNQAFTALDRLRGTLEPLPKRLLPSLRDARMDWDAVCLEYPQDGETPGDLLQTAAVALGEAAEERVSQLEKQRLASLRQVAKPAQA